MRNLLLLDAHSHPGAWQPTPGQPDDRPLQVCADQNQPHIVYVASTRQIRRLDITTTTTSTPSSATIFTTSAEPAAAIVDIQHLSLNDELCVATAGGDVHTLSLHAGHQLAGVGFCAGGIRRMAWSPDQEAVAFVTGAGVLCVMDSLYTPLAECVLSEAGFGEGAFVNVGWGAKETQFHGTEGKAARFRQPDQPAAEEAATASSDEAAAAAAAVAIVWRGDAEYFAVSFNANSGRQFKVFDKEGRLQFTSESAATGLSAHIAWRPSGTWLAVPQRLCNKYVIALFEKNGLKHREIVLPFAPAEELVVGLEWSSDSEVLAVQALLVASGQTRIYLYTIGNYHWYAKQTLDFADSVRHFVWDSVQAKQLHLLSAAGDYCSYQWTAEISGTRTLRADDQAIVASIDGRSVLLTGFRGAVVPPPMCSVQVQLERHCNWVEFVACVAEAAAEAQAVNRFIAVDSANVVHVFGCAVATGGLLAEVRELGVYRPEVVTGSPLTQFTHWLYLSAETVICAAPAASDQPPRLLLCRLSDGALRVLATKPLPAAANRLCAVSADEIAVATAAGVHRLRLEHFGDEAMQLSTPLFTYPDRCEHLMAAGDGGRDLFALKPKHWLYHNGRLVASDATSMLRTQHYALYTTLDRLRFVRLADAEECGDRRVERGSRLVATVAHDCRTLLQMPRGNLEAVQPRVLALRIIGAMLDAGEWRRAFDAMRKQRINLNLLMDHDRGAFLAGVERVVADVRQANWLNLFLSDVDEADVTCTMYASNYPGRMAEVEQGGKVAEVCRRVREAIEALRLGGELLLPVLTSYVKEGGLAEALQIVWQLKRREAGEAEAEAAVSGVEVSADEALKYLLYLVDVNQLYNVALGTYEFGLVRYVATKSQKDPKEYLPQLAAFEAIADPAYRQYRIDVYLRRFERALQHIVACGAERAAECCELVQKHALYTQALREYARRAATEAEADAEGERLVVLAFAAHLREAGKFRDACLMYERGGDWAQAILSARHILDWQKCVELTRRLGASAEEVAAVAVSLVPALVENGQRLEAAQLVQRYERDAAKAVRILCDGGLYVQALFEARMADGALVDSLIRPHLQSYADTICSALAADCDQFVEHKNRLHTIRSERAAAETRAAAAATDPHGDADYLAAAAGDADLDAFSDTSSLRSSSRGSASSRGTGKTHRSSKNRRKHERKLLSLKPGNPFEDIALVDALHGLAHKAFDQQQPVRALGKALIDQRLDAEGRRVQAALRLLLRTVSGALAEIWLPEMAVSGECVPLAEDGRLDYALVQREQHYAMIKPHQRYKPLLKAIDWEFDVLE